MEMITDCPWGNAGYVKTPKEVHAEKKAFVDELNTAMQMLPGIERVEYFDLPSQREEFVRINTEGGGRDCICMTANSLEAMLVEIARYIYGMDPAGLILNEAHCLKIDEWIEDAK